MKRTIYIFCMALITLTEVKAQEYPVQGKLYKNNLPKAYIDTETSVHFISPEPIKFVDISTDKLIGDISLENVFRLKAVKENIDPSLFQKTDGQSLGVVTIIGEKFIAQYDIRPGSQVETQIEILPKDTAPLNVGHFPLSKNQLRSFSLQAIGRDINPITRSKAYGITAQLNNIYAVDDYIFLDITYLNATNLKYDIDQIAFRVEDKKIVKATNMQAVEIAPVYTLNEKHSFKRKYRNIYVLKKFTFPNNKLLTVELTEKQLSGRIIKLQIDYSDLLNADTL